LDRLALPLYLHGFELTLMPGSHETSRFRILSAEEEPVNPFKFGRIDSTKPKTKKKKDYIQYFKGSKLMTKPYD